MTRRLQFVKYDNWALSSVAALWCYRKLFYSNSMLVIKRIYLALYTMYNSSGFPRNINHLFRFDRRFQNAEYFYSIPGNCSCLLCIKLSPLSVVRNYIYYSDNVGTINRKQPSIIVFVHICLLNNTELSNWTIYKYYRNHVNQSFTVACIDQYTIKGNS